MPFEDLAAPPQRGGRHPRMSAQELKGGGVKITLSVPLELMPKGERFRIAFGTGRERGKLLLAPDPGGRFVPRSRRKPQKGGKGAVTSASFNLGEAAFAPDHRQKPTPLTHETTDAGLLLTLPAWAFLPPEFDRAEDEAA